MASDILIVDDEPIILQTLKIIFKRAGIEVDTESDPENAISRFIDTPYNIALVDVLMPEMQGAEVIRAFKKENPLCNIVVMTAFSTMTRVVECIEAGAFDYVTKPFTDVGLLVGVVKTSIERVERWKKSFGVELNAKKTGGRSE
jgi:two-component system NtrC family response regulator